MTGKRQSKKCSLDTVKFITQWYQNYPHLQKLFLMVYDQWGPVIQKRRVVFILLLRDKQLEASTHHVLPPWLEECICQQAGFPGGSVIKNPLSSAGNAQDAGSNSGWGRSPGVGYGNPSSFCFFCFLGFFAWKTPWTEESGGLQTGVTKNETI